MGYTSLRMNIKVALGIVIVAIILVISFFLLHPRTVSAPTTVTPAEQSATASTTSQPSQLQQTSQKLGTTGATITELIARFNSIPIVSTSAYPTISGIANTPKVGIIINNSKDKGIVGTANIPVIRGQWSYSTSVALVPGTYTVVLFVGKTVTEVASLIVNAP